MPNYRFNGDIVFSPTLSESGELHFTVPTERLRGLGLPLGRDVCIQVGYRGATIEAENRTIAYDVLRDAVHNAGTPQMQLRTCNERSWDYSRADVLYVQERQLLQFTPEEQADPDTINSSTSPGRKRRSKLRRILGMRQFVLAHPNLPIRCRDEMCPAGRLILNCSDDHESGLSHHGYVVSITCITSINPVRIHLKDLNTGLETYIAPADAHAFDVFMLGVASATPANLEHPGTVVIHQPPHVSTEEGLVMQQQHDAWLAEHNAWTQQRAEERDAWMQAHPEPPLPSHAD